MTNKERIGKVLEALEKGNISEDRAVELVTALNPAVCCYYSESQNQREIKKEQEAISTIRAI